jgi:hypothetical protein
LKGNKMSAILAMLLMLSGTLLVFPIARVNAANANVHVIVRPGPAVTYNGPQAGLIFTEYINVTDVSELLTYSVGFYFNSTVLKVHSITYGTALWVGVLPADRIAYDGVVHNDTGVVEYYTASCKGSNYNKTATSLNLMTVVFEVDPAYTSTYTGTYPGTPVDMILMSTTDQTILLYLADANGNAIPIQGYDHGTFTLHAVPLPPTATYFISSPVTPPYYAGVPMTFDASGSKAGSTGMAPYDSPINDYAWTWGDGSPVEHDAVNTATHTYTTPGTYNPILVTTAQNGLNATFHLPVAFTVLVKPTGCIVDAFTQPWRYIDPITMYPVAQGKGYGQLAELFRPGDLVHVYVVTSYNGDPVQNQPVTIEVFDNQHNIVLTSVAVTNYLGLGELDFRIPWPCTGPTPEFGMWEVFVTWEIGNNTAPRNSITQNDTLFFNVGWGVWSENLDVGGPYFVGGTMQIKYTLHNDYMVPVTVLNTITIYDDLTVPVGYAAVWVPIPALSAVNVGPISIVLPKWTFVGQGTVKADELTTFPSSLGIAWGPEQVATFGISHTTNPADP